MINLNTLEIAKQRVAVAAIYYIDKNLTKIGLGSGSTAIHLSSEFQKLIQNKYFTKTKFITTSKLCKEEVISIIN